MDHGCPDTGSASIWTLAVSVVVLMVGCAAMELTGAVAARHQAEAAADLAALAAASTMRDGGNGCAAAARVAVANHAWESACSVADDASVSVTVVVVLPSALMRWARVGVVEATSRAGS